MLSHIIGIIFIVLGLLMETYVVLDETKFNNNEEDFNLILFLVGLLLAFLGVATYKHIWIFSCALDELLV